MLLAFLGGRAVARALVIVLTALLGLGIAVSVARAQPDYVADRLTVEVVGQGPDVILAPGLASSREAFRPLADRLKPTHRVHLVQLSGFAGQPWTGGEGPFVDPAVEALATYIRSAGLRQPAVIGHSMGGLSGLLLAQRHPELVGRLMTIDSLPFYSAMFGPTATSASARPFADRMAASVLSASPEAFAAQQTAAAKGLSRTPAMQETIVAWSLASDRKAVARAISEVMTLDARPGLAAMKTPVTALYAVDAEGALPPAVVGALWMREYDALPGVKLVRVEGSRHFIMADQPEAFAKAVDGFLK
ncbi:alpha/beta fold hydrolase [Caulobacter endophyticus]|uniref:Alpha/beta hydrolase n=1 Tax=Caulobacter endophyticus TaxID=2172652 RepID=A0A2T9K4W3_9CAUL|nr:alpha/beta hydrolase [Caulobacter endophyticus]PVM91020.1 alpha/beta hydrolase [Caulobacter endophyticus]